MRRYPEKMIHRSRRAEVVSLLLAATISGGIANAQASADAPTKEEAEAQANTERQTQASKAQIALHLRVLEQCGLSTGSTEYPAPYTYDGTSRTERRVFSITAWTGGCRDSKRDGQGTLVTREDDDTGPDSIKGAVLIKAEGRFVSGRQQGLWCTLEEHTFSNGEELHLISGERCRILAGAAASAAYHKLADGRWEQVGWNGSPAVPSIMLAAGTLEADSNRIIAEATQGKADPVLRPFNAQSSALDGLLAGASISLVEGKEPDSIKGKRVALILSNISIAELARFTVDRQSLIDRSAGLIESDAPAKRRATEMDAVLADADASMGIGPAGTVQRQRARLIEASRPEMLLQAIARSLRGVAAQIEPVDDLTGLAQGRFDYAFVVDWHSLTRFDLLGKFQAQRVFNGSGSDNDAIVAGQQMGGLLITPDLKLAAIYTGTIEAAYKTSDCVETRRERTCDREYLKALADFYEGRWIVPSAWTKPFSWQVR